MTRHELVALRVRFMRTTRRGTWADRLAAALEGVLSDDQEFVKAEARALLNEYKLDGGSS